ncbi:MAG: hypothetical protein ACO3A4_11755 [Silvanigrellaceae bacterium]
MERNSLVKNNPADSLTQFRRRSRVKSGSEAHSPQRPIFYTHRRSRCGASEVTFWKEASEDFVCTFSLQKQKPRKRKRIPWAQLLKRTFKIDVLKCDKCGGRMKLVAVVFDPPTIATTLRALGLPVRAPPIAPARSRSLLDSGHLGRDWTGADVDHGRPE